jgi:hypothetical protein
MGLRGLMVGVRRVHFELRRRSSLGKADKRLTTAVVCQRIYECIHPIK